MKKLKHMNLVKTIASSTCLLGASAGIIFGVSAGKFSIDYVNLEDAMTRINAALNYNYRNQDIKSEWNMLNVDEETGEELEVQAPQPTTMKIDEENWNALHALHGKKVDVFHPKDVEDREKTTFDLDKPVGQGGISETARQNRYDFVGMVLDGASHAALDRSFNESVFHGLLDFSTNVDNAPIQSELDVHVLKPAQDTNVEFQNVYRAMASEKDTRLIALGGFVHVAPLETLGVFNHDDALFHFNDECFDKMCMLLIDGSIKNNQNIASVLFRSDQAGFLTAISTGMYFLNNANIYHVNYRPLSVGVFGGTPIPTVTIYMGGFQRGVEFFNHFVLKGMLHKAFLSLNNPGQYGEVSPDTWQILKSSMYYDEIEQWKNDPSSIKTERKQELIGYDYNDSLVYNEYKIHIAKLGDFNTNFTGSFAPGDAIGITKQLLNRGVSAILPVAGSQTTDTVQEVYNQNSNCIVIGVDAAMEDGDNQRKYRNPDFKDQSYGIDGSLPEYADGIIKFSAVKDMASVTERIAYLCANNLNFDIADPNDESKPDPNVAVCNVGYQTCGNIQNGLVSVSWDGWAYLIQALSHVQMLWDKQSLSFEEIWGKAVDKYFEDQGWMEGGVVIDTMKDFYDNVTKFSLTQAEKDAGMTGVCTFKKYIGEDEEGKPIPTAMYANYSHVISILGSVLSDPDIATLNFPENITLALPQNEQEAEEWHPEIATEPQQGTILDWLKYNMYYMN